MKNIDVNKYDTNVRVAVITSRFNVEITERLFASAQAQLACHSISDEQVRAIWVPGAIEIPMVARKLAQHDLVDAIVCLGAVIRGQTSHYDYVCEQVSQGCASVMRDFGLPVVFGILTTENKEQALARSGGDHSDVGASSVDTALEMVTVLRQLMP
jgi:6,7-dimethyl-8-ribityllumazine synthase